MMRCMRVAAVKHHTVRSVVNLSRFCSSTTTPTAASDTTTCADFKSLSFDHLGVSLQIPESWMVQERVFKGATSTLFLVNPDATKNTTEAPSLVLTAEDLRPSNLDQEQYSAVIKTLWGQMIGSSRGNTSPPPTVREEPVTQLGPFAKHLELQTATVEAAPPAAQGVRVLSAFLTVGNGVGYVLQQAGVAAAVEANKPLFERIAAGVTLHEHYDPTAGVVRVRTGTIEAEVYPLWSWELPLSQEEASSTETTKDASATRSPSQTGLLTIRPTPQAQSEEKAVLYDTASTTAAPELRNVVKISEGRIGNSDVTLTCYAPSDGSSSSATIKTLSLGKFTFVVTAGKAPDGAPPLSQTSWLLNDEVLARVLASVKPCSDASVPKSSTFVCAEYGFQFSCIAKSEISSSKLRQGLVHYTPRPHLASVGNRFTALIQSREVANGLTLEALRRSFDEIQDPAYVDITLTHLKGSECLRYTEHRRFEREPGVFKERWNHVFVFLRAGRHTTVSWQCDFDKFEQHEADWLAFWDSFQFI